MDDKENQNYKENEAETKPKPTGVHLRKLKQGYMIKQLEWWNHLEQQPLRLIKIAYFVYDGDSPINNDNEIIKTISTA